MSNTYQYLRSYLNNIDHNIPCSSTFLRDEHFLEGRVFLHQLYPKFPVAHFHVTMEAPGISQIGSFPQVGAKIKNI